MRHGDVAEDEDDAEEVAVFIADGSAGVVDEEFRAVTADQDGVIGKGDAVVEPLDLGDGMLERLASGLVDDVEDLVDGQFVGFVVVQPVSCWATVVHGLDASLGVAGDDAVADGLEGCAQLSARSGRSVRRGCGGRCATGGRRWRHPAAGAGCKGRWSSR